MVEAYCWPTDPVSLDMHILCKDELRGPTSKLDTTITGMTETNKIDILRVQRKVRCPTSLVVTLGFFTSGPLINSLKAISLSQMQNWECVALSEHGEGTDISLTKIFPPRDRLKISPAEPSLWERPKFARNYEKCFW